MNKKMVISSTLSFATIAYSIAYWILSFLTVMADGSVGWCACQCDFGASIFWYIFGEVLICFSALLAYLKLKYAIVWKLSPIVNENAGDRK